MNDYDPIEKAQDATKFAETQFGQFFLDRIARVRDEHYRKARSLQRDGADLALIAAEVARADEMDGELAWFAQAKEITESPTLMKRIRDSLKKKAKKADE